MANQIPVSVLLSLIASQYHSESRKVVADNEAMGDSAKRAAAEEAAAHKRAAREIEATDRQRTRFAQQMARDRAREVKAALRQEVDAYRERMRVEAQSAAQSRASLNSVRDGIFNLRNAVAALGLAALAKDLLAAAIAAQQIKIGFDVAANSAAGGAAVYAHVRDEAHRLGLSLQETATQYSSFAISARLAGLTVAETDTVFRGVAEAGTVLHLSAERMTLTLLALEQMAGKGVVQMEELKRQLGNQIPGAVEIFAQAMGVSVKEFYKLVQAGKVTAAELPKFGLELSKVFGPGLAAAVKSAQAEMNRVKSALFELRAAAGEGLLEGLAEGFSGLQRSLQADELKAQARELGKELGAALKAASEFALFLAENIDKIKAALVLLLAVQAAGWITKLGAGLAGLSLSVNSLAYVTPLAARGLGALGATAGGATVALGGIGIVLGAAAFAMQSYITAQAEAARVQQAELADSANVLRYLDQLRERKEKLTAEEWSMAEAITTRLRAEETAANSDALKALYRLNEARRSSPAPRFSESAGYIDDSAKIRALEQAYEDAKGRAGGFRGELALLDQQLKRVGHETKKTGTDTGELSKEMDRARDAVAKQVRELERLADARRAEQRAALEGPKALQIEERRAYIAGEVAKAAERMAKVKGGLDPAIRAELEAAAAAAYDAGKGLDVTRAAMDRMRDSSASARETAAALRDQLSGTSDASREVAARLEAEAAVRGTVFDGIESVVAGLAAENLARIQSEAAIDRQIQANQRERDAASEIAELQARVTDARYQMTAASDEAAAATQILNLAVEQGATLFSAEWNAIVLNVQGHRQRVKALTEEEAAQGRLNEFLRRRDGLRAEFADWKERADAVRRYGSTIAGLLDQYGLLSSATRELALRERALADARSEGADLRTAEGQARLAEILAELRGYEDQLDAIKRVQVEQEIAADMLQPLADAWQSVGQQGRDALLDWALEGKKVEDVFRDLAATFKREMLSAILEVLKRWILAEYAKRAEAIKTAAVSRAAVAASGGSGGSRLTDVGSYSTFFQGGTGAGATGAGSSSAGASASTLAGAALAAYALYVVYLAFIKDHRAKFSEATLGGGTRGNDQRSAAKLKELLKGLADQALAAAKDLRLGLDQLAAVTLGQFDGKYYVKDPGVNLAGVGRAFDTVEEAMEYVQVRAIQLGEVSDRVGLLVQQALKNSRAVTLEGLKSDIDFARLLQNAGLDSSLAELQTKLSDFITDFADNWKRAIDLFGRDLPALAQALAGVGQLTISAFQNERDLLTGRTRTQAEELQLAQARAKIWNATKAVMESQIALQILELKARIANAQAARTALGGGGGTGSGGSGNRGTGDGTGTTVISGILAFSQAMVTTAQVAVTSAAVITNTAATQLAALEAQLAALEALQQALRDIPDIDLGDVVVPGGGGTRGGGGTSKADDAAWLKDFFEQFRRARLSDVGRAIAEINDRYEEARRRARGNAEELAKLNEQRQKEIDLIKKNLKRSARDFIGKGGDLGATLRGVDDQVGDLIKSYRDLHDAGEITTAELHRMVDALKDAAAAQRLAIVQTAYSDVLISLLDATGRTEEAAKAKWELAVLEYRIKIEELKIAIEKYKLEGFNMTRLEKLLDDFIGIGPPTDQDGPGPPGGVDIQELYRQRLAENQAAADKLREDAAALLRRYQDDQLSPFQRALRNLAADFGKIRAVFGNTAEVQQAYNSALMRIIEDQVRPIEEWLNSVSLSDNAPSDAAGRLAETQRQFSEVFAAVQGGQYERIGELMQLADQLLGAQAAINPQASQAYRDFYAALRAQMEALLAQIRTAGGAGQVLGGPGTGGITPALPPVAGVGGLVPGPPANGNAAAGVQQAVEASGSMMNYHLLRVGGFTERTANAVERIARQGENRPPAALPG